MSWTLFDHDLLTGRKVWFSLDEAPEGKTAWRVEMPIDSVIEANAEAEKATHGAKLPDWNRVASVPINIMEKTGLDVAVQARDNRFLSKFLNDSDNAKFRTSRGRV